MKYVFTLLFLSLLSVGCSSNNDNTSVPDNIETSDPALSSDNGDDTPDDQDDAPIEPVLNQINEDNYADLISLVEEVGFNTLTRDYNLGILTGPFTFYTNEIFEDPNAIELDVNDTRDCNFAGTTETSGSIVASSSIFFIRYDLDECQTAAGTANGTAFYDVLIPGANDVNHDFDIEFTDVDIKGERGVIAIK